MMHYALIALVIAIWVAAIAVALVQAGGRDDD